MAGHWTTLPLPEPEDVEFKAALVALRPRPEAESWVAIHVLYSKCRCSQRVLDHLFETQRPEGLDETILLVGADEGIEARTNRAGFHLVVVNPSELQTEYHIVSAPLLLVLSPDDAVRYAGGYTGRKQGYDVHDLEIVDAVRNGRAADRLPLYGCGVSKELQNLLDPIGIKYG
jgi:hypothetical protein